MLYKGQPGFSVHGPGSIKVPTCWYITLGSRVWSDKLATNFVWEALRSVDLIYHPFRVWNLSKCRTNLTYDMSVLHHRAASTEAQFATVIYYAVFTWAIGVWGSYQMYDTGSSPGQWTIRWSELSTINLKPDWSNNVRVEVEAVYHQWQWWLGPNSTKKTTSQAAYRLPFEFPSVIKWYYISYRLIITVMVIPVTGI